MNAVEQYESVKARLEQVVEKFAKMGPPDQADVLNRMLKDLNGAYQQAKTTTGDEQLFWQHELAVMAGSTVEILEKLTKGEMEWSRFILP